jgi:hypothetical protein
MVTKINEHKLVDQVIPKKSDKIINIVRNPRGFITAPTNDGVIASPENDISDDEFKVLMKTLFRENNYDVSLIVNKYTALPDNEDEFMGLFYNEVKNQIKNPMLFQSRIMGLVSYFSTQNKSLLPTVTVNEVVEVPMSNYQFLAYSKIRKKELEQDKSKKETVKPKGKSRSVKSKKSESDDANLFDDKKSSYRAFSRMHCSFVFPESVPRPYKTFKIDETEKQLLLKSVEDDLKKLFKKDVVKLKDTKDSSVIEHIKEHVIKLTNEIEQETHGSENYISLLKSKENLEVKIANLTTKKLELTAESDELDEEYDKRLGEETQKEMKEMSNRSSIKVQKKAVKDY